MLLILTNSYDATADYLVSRMGNALERCIRLDTDKLLDRIAVKYRATTPMLRIDDEWHSPDAFSNVWYRRPERLRTDKFGDTPESICVLDEWSEALEGFLAHIPRCCWMNHPASNALASRKLEQLTTAERIGFRIPETLVTQEDEELKQFSRLCGGEIIVKPLGRAFVERSKDASDSLIFTNAVQASELEDLTDLAACPTLFQRALRKVTDVRITVVDDAIHAMTLTAHVDGRQRCDIRRNNMNDVIYAPITLPTDVACKVRTLTSHYGLRFAAIDMALEEDQQWYFFEVNPNGQWAWLDICGGAEIYKSFLSSFSIDLKVRPESL